MTAVSGQGGPVPGSRGQDGDKYAEWDAAYVLGSLSETDRREFEAHLDECRTCWDAVTELSGMPALLSLLDLDDIADEDDPIAVRPPLPQPDLIGRQWEMSVVAALLKRAIGGHGAVVGVVGSAGIGKSRLVREVSAMADAHDVDVFSAFCESHTSQIPFHTVTRLLRAVTGVESLDPPAARAQIRAQAPDAAPEDLLLYDDLLGIADPDVELPKIDPDARRRRLTMLVNAASLA
ncbi:MAG TPA: zf-HC2 domain-containing protein, partial [Mycobacterium sp.]|nr:zf-HC2 domain-containing protein [Mycobacterium sp.]